MIITVALGKGGTGKTSTALALVGYARKEGRRVLAVDCDPQANFTYALGADPAAPGLYSVLTGRASCLDVLQRTDQADVVPAGLDLAAIDSAIMSKPGRDFLLREALKPIRDSYDLVVIDTQPDLNVMLINALSTSDGVLLPVEADAFAMMGLYQIQATIQQVQQLCNPDLDVLGIVLTKYKPRQVLAADMREAIEGQAEQMGTRVFDTYIREGVAVRQAQAMRQSVYDYAPKSNPARDYAALCQEIGL